MIWLKRLKNKARMEINKMARVSKETKEKVKAVLEEEANQGHLGKCTLCNQTLLHLCKSTEVIADAPMSTVLNQIVELVNESALPADKVTVGQLKGRVQRESGTGGQKVIGMNHADKSPESNEVCRNDNPLDAITEIQSNDEDKFSAELLGTDNVSENPPEINPADDSSMDWDIFKYEHDIPREIFNHFYRILGNQSYELTVKQEENDELKTLVSEQKNQIENLKDEMDILKQLTGGVSK